MISTPPVLRTDSNLKDRRREHFYLSIAAQFAKERSGGLALRQSQGGYAVLGVNSQFQNVVFAMPKQSQSPEPDPDLIEIPEESAPDFGMEMAWMRLAPSTRRQYESALRHLDKWLEETGRELTDATLARYLLLRHNGRIEIHRRYRKADGTYRVVKQRRKASPPTIKNVCLAARFRCEALDQPIPTGRHVKNALKQISAKGRGRGQAPRTPGSRTGEAGERV